MATIQSSADIMSVLQDIVQRSHHGKSSQQDEWTAIGFRVANNYFLVPIDQADEVFPLPTQITPVPKAKPWVFGISNIRGTLLPLFDLKLFLFEQVTQLNNRSRIMVINYQGLFSGLLIDEVFGLRHLAQKPQPSDDLKDTAVAPYIEGSISQDNINWHIFSFNSLATDQRFLDSAA